MEQDELYRNAVAEFGPALQRLAKSYERDAGLRRDLLQDIHFALWRSLATFAGQCSLRSWVYRVAHNTAVSTKLRRRGREPTLIGLEDIAELQAPLDAEENVGTSQAVAKLEALIRRLKTPDSQIMLLYLEYLDAQTISEITGLSPGAVATRIHRIKALLARQFAQGERP